MKINFINKSLVFIKKNEHSQCYIKMLCFSFLLGLPFIAPYGYANQNDEQLWTSIVATLPISDKKPKIKYWLELQQRIGEDFSQLSQLLIRPGLGYQLTPFTSIWLGYAAIYTAQPFTSSPFTEKRIWEQLLWGRDYSLVRLTSRSRLEQRFIPRNIHTAWRYRQLLRAAVTILHHEKQLFIISDEVFFHLNDFNHQNNEGLDQNRFFVGFGHKTSKESTIEIGYLNQTIHRADGSRYNGHNVLITLVLNK